MFDDFYIQSVLIPNQSLKINEKSYINLENAYCDLLSESIIFGVNGYASFDTYYNAISLSVWNDLCDINSLKLSLRGSGDFFIQQVIKNESNDEIILASCHMQLSPNIDSDLPIIKFSELPKKGLLFFKVWSTTDGCKLMSGKWSSLLAPRQDVKLGIVITHFNRKQYVLPSLQRISEQLLTDQFYKDRIDFVVVDNSQNISQEESCGITIIPNENLGGSGGFTRGLKYFHERGDITHVLFMDDDASCEIDSIRRAYSILQFSKAKNTAISGALLREDITYSLIEQGASFDRVCRPSHHGKDVRLTSTLLDIEYSNTINGYGAWWFFAFPLNSVTSYPFPFFVRGDDVLFGMMNAFNIISPMGICCYGEDFSTKVSALTRYLDFRAGYVNMLYHKQPAFKVIKAYINLYLSVLFSGQYSSLKCIRRSLTDTMNGDSFWQNNVSMKDVREDIALKASDEKPIPIDISKISYIINNNEESKIRRIIRLFSLNGILLPFKKDLVLHKKGSRASLRQIHRYSDILYYDENTKTGFTVKVNRMKFLKSLLLMCFDCLNILIRHKILIRKYARIVPNLANKDFWTKVYK